MNLSINTYVLPQSFGYSKKKIWKDTIAYIVFLLIFALAFWYGTGKFFTEDYYYPAILIIMPLASVVVFILAIKQVLLLRKNAPVLVLTDEGIYCNTKDFKDLGVIKWTDITRCFSSPESMFGNVSVDTNLQIHVSNADAYLDRMRDTVKRTKIMRQAAKKQDNALLWVNVAHLECDMNNLKKTIFELSDKNQNQQNFINLN